jgi:thiamine pyrophosphokinase
MRGIAFIGGEGPAASWWRDLAEGAPFAGALVVAADSGLIAAEAAGIRPQWVIGDMDSLDDPRRLEKYPACRVLRYPTDKDYTDTELALTLLWEQGCDETWLAGGGGGRTDHLLAIRALFERARTPNRWITAAEDIRCLEAGDTLSLGAPGVSRREAEEGSGIQELPGIFGISVFPLGVGPWKAESRGLKWPLEGLPWDRGFFGISNAAPGGVFSIRALAGRFLVSIPLNDKRTPFGLG